MMARDLFLCRNIEHKGDTAQYLMSEVQTDSPVGMCAELINVLRDEKQRARDQKCAIRTELEHVLSTTQHILNYLHEHNGPTLRTINELTVDSRQASALLHDTLKLVMQDVDACRVDVALMRNEQDHQWKTSCAALGAMKKCIDDDRKQRSEDERKQHSENERCLRLDDERNEAERVFQRESDTCPCNVS